MVEKYFYIIVQYAILFTEFIGVAVLVWTVIKSAFKLFGKQKSHLRLDLAEGIALSLEFKMGGELLRTVIAREWSELLILGAVIVLRSALTFLIHWEINMEKKEGKSLMSKDTPSITEKNSDKK